MENWFSAAENWTRSTKTAIFAPPTLPSAKDSAMTLGTWLYTKFKGQKVGEDELGNVYYRSSRMRAGNREERWVIFLGEAEASKVPPEWHAWLHHTTDEPIQTSKRPWQKPHQSNLTGTELAYLPSGDDRRGGERAGATGDYEAWTPDA